MPTTFRSIATATVLVPAASITVVRPADVAEGDLMLLLLAIADPASNTLTLPTGWTSAGVSGAGTVRVFFAFKYVTDNEPTQYQFTHTAARVMIGAIAAYVGAQRDYNFDLITYPNGYYAPDGSLGANVTGSSASLTSVSGSNPSTTIVNTRVVYAFAQYDSLAGTPEFDDVSPLVAIRARVQIASLALMVCDEEYEETASPVALLTVNSSLNKPWQVGSIAIEPYEVTAESVDNYKSKLLRRTLPPPYDTRLSSRLGKLLAIIGTSDNDIGGLFGDDDFLPDEEV